MSSASAGPPAVDVFGAFVRELALFPQGPDMLDRLRKGHAPGRHGWCSHPAHAHRWERYPCTILRLADLVEGLDVRDRPAEPGRSG
jgi:hypothetical protein